MGATGEAALGDQLDVSPVDPLHHQVGVADTLSVHVEGRGVHRAERLGEVQQEIGFGGGRCSSEQAAGQREGQRGLGGGRSIRTI